MQPWYERSESTHSLVTARTNVRSDFSAGLSGNLQERKKKRERESRNQKNATRTTTTENQFYETAIHILLIENMRTNEKISVFLFFDFLATGSQKR
jgi:hypothetical protein